MRSARGSGLLPWILLLACVPLAWMFGFRRADTTSAQQSAIQQQSIREERDQLVGRIKELESSNTQLRLSLDIALARTESLQQGLNETIDSSIQDAAELALYRRIASGEGAPGLQVERVEFQGSPPDTMAVTLLQIRGRDRATGELAASIMSRNQGVWQRRMLATTQAGEWTYFAEPSDLIDALLPQPGISTVEQVPPDVVPVAQFDLRFFQTLLFQVEGITTVSPEWLEIWLLPDGGGQQATVQRYRWGDISLSADR